MEAPFKIGQKVVAITTDAYNGFRKKGNIYTVLQLDECPKCGRWSISPISIDDSDNMVCSCKKLVPSRGRWWHYASAFAPIEPTRERIKYVAVSETLSQTAVEIAAVESN